MFPGFSKRSRCSKDNMFLLFSKINILYIYIRVYILFQIVYFVYFVILSNFSNFDNFKQRIINCIIFFHASQHNRISRFFSLFSSQSPSVIFVYHAAPCISLTFCFYLCNVFQRGLPQNNKPILLLPSRSLRFPPSFTLVSLSAIPSRYAVQITICR